MSKKSTEEFEKETQGKHYVVDSRNILPLDKVGGNPRTDYGDKDGSFMELVGSVKEHGLIESIKAYRDPENPGKWRSLSGHTRMKVCEYLGYKDKDGNPLMVKVIPVDIRKYSNLDILYETVNGNKGRQLNVLEITEVVRRATDEGASVKEIAAGLGYNMHQIRSFILLSNAPKRIRDLISQDSISYWTAIDFIKTSTDYNEAIDKIERALTKATETKTSSDGSGSKKVKVGRRELNEENNVVDSCFELKKVFKEQIDNPQKVKNNDLYFFAKMIVENKYTASDIKKRFF